MQHKGAFIVVMSSEGKRMPQSFTEHFSQLTFIWELRVQLIGPAVGHLPRVKPNECWPACGHEPPCTNLFACCNNRSRAQCHAGCLAI